MKTPTAEAMLTAAEWLEINDGEERADCLAVCAWLRERAEKIDSENALKAAAKAANVALPVARLLVKSIKPVKPSPELMKALDHLLK